ncbi:hypothetical protein CLU79DRAFT_189612 [Phycomyces nitens]|nr:hypothetical protein CLU79DRAFT_189612 [Phycomyces nitens]
MLCSTNSARRYTNGQYTTCGLNPENCHIRLLDTRPNNSTSTCGIGAAVGSMAKVFYDDKILGIYQYSSMLKGYSKEEEEEEEEDCQTTPKAESSDPSILDIPLAQKSEKDKVNNTMISDSYKLCSRAIRLRDRLINDQKEKNINIEDDNSAYLAAFLHALGPENAKKTKHCILSGSLIIGYENEDKTLNKTDSCLSSQIITSGPGATCKYQKEIMPWNVRHLSTDMIDNLESAHNMDETSYIEICVTFGQLFFTTIACMDIDGDRWAKVIIIIYTAMSVLQATSLFILHKQSMSFSIKDDQELSPEAIKAPLIKEDCEQLAKPINAPHFDNPEYITIISMILGIIASLFIGIWADYNAHSTTEWLVLSWIISPIPIAVFFIIINVAELNGSITLIAFFLLPIASIGCLIAATIVGYLPK